jgi:hypothetical protein
MIESVRKEVPASVGAEVPPEPLPWVRDEEPALV